jgi:hypothetical protein
MTKNATERFFTWVPNARGAGLSGARSVIGAGALHSLSTGPFRPDLGGNVFLPGTNLDSPFRITVKRPK